ncbi:MAG: PIG-L family deacetylase [Chloroflexi bacterium]|nr:PIG-L family deacetylase [Chloroflexota bacterium]
MQLTSFKDITTKHRHIFLSPHFDDVVYSCGGTLGVQVSSGLRPLVITVFGGVPPSDLKLSPFALQVHREMGVSAAQGVSRLIETRRKEDAAALDYLEVDYLWLDYLDAMYRGEPPYYPDKNAVIGGDVHPADLWIDKQLAEDLIALRERLPDTVWYAPLGAGRHVDHQIVCSAVDRLTQRGAKVNLYEDFPYVQREPGALDARLKELGGTLELALVEMSEFLPVRLAAADIYATQIGVNFGNQEAMHKAMESYTHGIRPVETVYLERYWTAR